MHDWRSHQLTSDYLEGVRGGIPLAALQIELIIRIIKAYTTDMKTFIDLGCGDGILGRNLYLAWPDARGIFVDFSEPMLQVAREKCTAHSNHSDFCPIDYGEDHWPDKIPVPDNGIDVIISGYSIHHQEDNKKYEIYQDIYNLLNPGGIFLNLEHVASRTATGEKLFDAFFIDSLWE